MSIPRLHSTSFDWFTWTGGNLTCLGVQHNFMDIRDKKRLLRLHALGYLEGEQLGCRPKPGYTAILFRRRDRTFWTHITNDEFRYCFPDCGE